MPNFHQHLETVTIASSAATSTAFQLYGYRIVGIYTPSAWTAADISFEVSKDGSTWVKVVGNDGALVKLTGVATGAAEFNVVPELLDFFTNEWCRVVSTNTASEADVNQDAARSLTLVLATLPGN